MLAVAIVSQIPVIAIIAYFYAKHPSGRAPVTGLLIAYVLGIASTLPAYILNTTLLPHPLPRTAGALFITCVLGVGVIEESCKFAALYLAVFRCRHFNSVYDGILYAVVAAIGFASLENLLYTARFGLDTGLVRAFTAVPLHALAGVLVGSRLALRQRGLIGRSGVLRGLLAAIIFHGMYDFYVFAGAIGMGFFLVLLLAMYTGRVARACVRLEQAQCADSVAGLVSNSRMLALSLFALYRILFLGFAGILFLGALFVDSRALEPSIVCALLGLLFSKIVPALEAGRLWAKVSGVVIFLSLTFSPLFFVGIIGLYALFLVKSGEEGALRPPEAVSVPGA